LNQEEVQDFQQKIMQWWAENERDLPWRRDPSPYNVLVSEIMLQQTQVSRVVPKFKEFMRTFPSIESLANSETKHLLQVWSGLGYNRRALWLKEAAKQIIECDGFPQSVKDLHKLKGVGQYTSRSILIFAFNHDLAAVDTNIRRVLIASGFADESTSDKELQTIADDLLLRGRSRDWHNALMDYGSLMLTSRKTGISPVTKQSCFEGSSRQVRGTIIKTLTAVDDADLETLQRLIDCEVKQSELESIIHKLVSDGLVEIGFDGRIRIAK
jgi:A/G-specific adenine glycosylase